MKNDIKKIEGITIEMDLNDKTYRKMQKECEELEEEMLFAADFCDSEQYENLEKVYFYRRVLSVLENDDLPQRAVLGLFCLNNILAELYEMKENYIGDSDRDTDIFELVIEYGYRQYERMFEAGGIVNAISKALMNYISEFGGEDNDE